MSNYKYSHSHRSSGRRIEVPITDEMRKLVPTSRICINAEYDTIYVYNGKARPVTAPISVDALTATDLLKQKIMDTFKIKEDAVIEWIGLVGDQLLELDESSLEDDQEKSRPCYVHKFSGGIPLIESVVIGGQPYFIQMKDVKTDFELLSEYPTSDRLLRPKRAYLSETCKYVFESEKEIRDYLKLANGKTAGLNFDLIFKLVKTIFKQYVVLEDHYITLLVVDIIYSYFQDHFGMTHYDFLVGDNGSGKNSVLTAVAHLAYRMLLATNVSAPNVFTFLGNVEEGQGTIALDEVDNLDNEHDLMNLLKSGYSRDSGRVPKTDLNSGRTQDAWWSYCYKIFASESSLDNSKAKGLLDRSFEIPCLVGKPKHNIKEVSHKRNEYLRKELEKTRKLLFACRMVHLKDTIEDVNLNIFNREAELTKPLTPSLSCYPYYIPTPISKVIQNIITVSCYSQVQRYHGTFKGRFILQYVDSACN